MDLRFFIVGAPFFIAFLYTLFWLRKWGIFNAFIADHSKRKDFKNNSFESNYFY